MADKRDRVNAISPGGVYNGQPQEFVDRLTQLIPMGRMAAPGEYEAAVMLLVSEAYYYMTGANLVSHRRRADRVVARATPSPPTEQRLSTS